MITSLVLESCRHINVKVFIFLNIFVWFYTHNHYIQYVLPCNSLTLKFHLIISQKLSKNLDAVRVLKETILIICSNYHINFYLFICPNFNVSVISISLEKLIGFIPIKKTISYNIHIISVSANGYPTLPGVKGLKTKSYSDVMLFIRYTA